MGLKDEDLDKAVEKASEGILAKLKNIFGGDGEPSAKPAEFSEEKLKELISTAVTGAKEEITAEFKEQIDTLTTENESLKKKVDGQISGGTHAANVAFAEAIPGEKGKHFLMRAGVVDFMDSLAAADAADGETKAINFSEGTGDDKVDHSFSRLEWFQQLVSGLPTMIQFGEKFGNIVATAEADAMITPDRAKELTDKMGVKKTDGGEK